jgi:hypothetical protein
VSSSSRSIAPPHRLQVAAAPDAADHVLLRQLDLAKSDRRVPLRVVVGVVRVVDDLDAGTRPVDDEQGRKLVGAVDDVRHHHVQA